MPLNGSHIAFITDDLCKKGLVYEPLKEELIDHICCSVEHEMSKNIRFREAYGIVIQKQFKPSELTKIQSKTLYEVNQKPKIMVRNYIKTAYRNLVKHKFYSLINVTGLAVGITSCLLILLFVQDELSYDQHHEKADRIYRISADIKFGGNHMLMNVAPAPMAETMVIDYPDVETTGRFRQVGSYLIKEEDQNVLEENVVFADKEILDIFTIPFIYGDPTTALEKPNTLIMSESASKRTFGDENPVGKQVTLNNEDLYEVVGVYEDMPANSHFHLNMMLSMEGLDHSKSTVWLSNNYQTYFLLREGAIGEDFESKLDEMVSTYTLPQAEQFLQISADDLEASGQWVKYHTMNVQDIHLQSNLGMEFEPNGNITYVYIFSAIALIILIIACINFMNLSTARSANRAKEVGVRKVLGSYRSHLIKQFLTESILLSFLGMLIALILAMMVLPYFNLLANKSLAIPFDSFFFIVGIISGVLIIGLIAGIYPSFFLSAFRPAAVLKGTLNLGVKSGWLRSTLVVMQFIASIFLIVGTLVIYQQLNYIQNKNLGFNKDQVIIIEDIQALGSNVEAFKNTLLQNSSISSATVSGFLPVSGTYRSDSGFWPEGEEHTETNSVSMQIWSVDHDYIPTLSMEIIEGRNFSRDFPSDTAGIILNERAMELFGYEDPIGKSVYSFRNLGPEGDQTMIPLKIIGIVKNFHFESLRDNINALSLVLGSRSGNLAIKVTTSEIASIVSLIEKEWKEVGPGQPFTYSFLDDRFARMYDQEERIGKIAFTFAGFAIFVASLGLFGLAAFTAEQRTKEIGVRKVMGASISSIIVLLSKEFGKLILIALIFAFPLSWIIMNGWLRDFHFRINIGPEVFLIAGGITLFIAWVTMSWQSIRAAVANPVDSLRNE